MLGESEMVYRVGCSEPQCQAGGWQPFGWPSLADLSPLSPHSGPLHQESESRDKFSILIFWDAVGQECGGAGVKVRERESKDGGSPRTERRKPGPNKEVCSWKAEGLKRCSGVVRGSQAWSLIR